MELARSDLDRRLKQPSDVAATSRGVVGGNTTATQPSPSVNAVD